MTLLLNAIDRVRMIAACSYREASNVLELPHGSVKRWRQRQQQGRELCQTPGPKKVQPLDMAEVRQAVRNLGHGPTRTAGTGRLYQLYRNGISRRVLAALIKAIRRELRREAKALQRRVEWRAPGLIWSMDDTEVLVNKHKVYIHRIRDLSTRHVIATWTGSRLISGPELAVWLTAQFRRYGAPLVFKRDNGSNLNHIEVDRVLAEYLVIPLNSPPYYPPYNGGMENSQREFKKALKPRLMGMPYHRRVVQMAAELADQELNHRPRPVLNHLSACLLYELGKPLTCEYNRRHRREVFEEIKTMMVELLRSLKRHGVKEQAIAWRRSVEQWLQDHGLITLHDPQKVLPGFYEK